MNSSLLAGHLWGQYIASSQARSFLTQQLTYKSKVEKQNVSLDIFASDTNTARHLYLAGLEKKHFSYKTKNVFVTYFKN